MNSKKQVVKQTVIINANSKGIVKINNKKIKKSNMVGIIKRVNISLKSLVKVKST